MSDLTEFVKARVAEDEADARHSGADAMTGYRWKHYPRDAYEEIQALALGRARRILAECEAKRHLLDEALVWGEGCLDVMARYMAEVYADRPAYDEAWRP